MMGLGRVCAALPHRSQSVVLCLDACCHTQKPQNTPNDFPLN